MLYFKVNINKIIKNFNNQRINSDDLIKKNINNLFFNYNDGKKYDISKINNIDELKGKIDAINNTTRSNTN